MKTKIIHEFKRTRKKHEIMSQIVNKFAQAAAANSQHNKSNKNITTH